MKYLIISIVLIVMSGANLAQTPSPTPTSCLVQTRELMGGNYVVTSENTVTPCPHRCVAGIVTVYNGTYFCTVTSSTSNRTDCGNGLPCGPIPWRLPIFPDLSSPTPIGTLDANQPTPTNVSTSPSVVLTATPTSFVNTGDISNAVATLNGVINATPISMDVDGTPVSLSASIGTLGGSATDFFSVVKAITSISFGPFSPIVSLFLLGFTIVFLIKATVFVIPVVAAVVGIIRKIYHAIMELIPL
jgi:hypothetical protein